MALKVLHINDKIEISGGVETNINDLCHHSLNYNIEPEWFGIYEEKSFKVRSYRIPDKELFKGDLGGLLQYLTQYVKEASIDIIHIHSLSAPKIISHCFKLAPVLRSMREPRMFCPGQGKFWRKSERICDQPFGLHCFYHAYTEGCVNRHPKRLLKAYENAKFEVTKGAKYYAAIFVMSDYMREESMKVGYDPGKLILNPHFTPPVEEDKLLDQSDAKVKKLIFVGRLSRTKGVHYFIKSSLQLLEKGYDIHLDIVGDGHDAEYFKSLVPKNYEHKFTFHGWQSRKQIDELLNQSYLMIFPSIYPEAFGISGIEAMVRGKPVVGFDVGGVSTWLKDQVSGHLVEVKNTDELIAKTESLLIDKNLYHTFSRNARKNALTEFSVDKHMNLLKETYHRILKN
jgi:glycosyltransferase involved in cell wall biosynthesis